MTGGGGVGGVRPDERAPHSALAGHAFFLALQGSSTSSVISPIGRRHRKVNCEYAWCAQFHSRNEFLGAHINAMLSAEGTLM